MELLYKSYARLSSGNDVLLEKEPKVKAPSIFFFRKKETKKPLP
jgi:hypothetical protein